MGVGSEPVVSSGGEVCFDSLSPGPLSGFDVREVSEGLGSPSPDLHKVFVGTRRRTSLSSRVFVL